MRACTNLITGVFNKLTRLEITVLSECVCTHSQVILVVCYRTMMDPPIPRTFSATGGFLVLFHTPLSLEYLSCLDFLVRATTNVGMISDQSLIKLKL